MGHLNEETFKILYVDRVFPARSRRS